MIVYRITLEKWSYNLFASGNSGRWNSKGNYVIYTASSRSLACLENLVHRSGEGLNSLFKIIEIEIPDDLKISEIKKNELEKDWFESTKYLYCQNLGDKWIRANKFCVLKVPSSIITEENNYILNYYHPDFKKIKIIRITDFLFDNRLMTK